MKKRIAAILCLIVLLVGMLPMTALAESTRYVYTSNHKSLNLRRDPITHSDNVIAQIPYGAAVTVHGHNGYDDWYYVTYKGHTGYVMARYIVKEQPANPTPDPDPAPGNLYAGFKAANYTAEVHASTPGGHVNLRWAPTKQANVHKKMADGAELLVVAQNGTWAQVIDLNTYTVGFMMRSFLRKI